MPPTVDYLPVAAAGGSNVDTQGAFAGSGYQTTGFVAGVAQSKQVNKVMRQASMFAACIANFISQTLNINVLDDGNLAGLITEFKNALLSLVASGSALVVVPFSATPIFDAAAGASFQLTLTGNVTSSTLINLSPGQKITFILIQDGVGGRTFVPPVNAPLGDIDLTIAKASVQEFIVDSGSKLRPLGGLTIS